MSDTETLAGDRCRPGRHPRQHARKRIRLPSGDELWPRDDLAAEARRRPAHGQAHGLADHLRRRRGLPPA